MSLASSYLVDNRVLSIGAQQGVDCAARYKGELINGVETSRICASAASRPINRTLRVSQGERADF
jgi:hypothetical protein